VDPVVVLPTLRGRAAEIEAVREWARPGSDGGVRVLLVEGEAGIGKTCLLEVARAEAQRLGRSVFVGRADEIERSRPFGVLFEALGWRAAGGVTVPASVRQHEEGGSDGDGGAFPRSRDPDQRFRMVDAIVGALEEVALDEPVALLLDDLQWADASTLLTLNAITRWLGYLDVAILATMRPVPRTRELARLVDRLDRDGARHLELGPLDDRAVADLATDVVGASPGAALRAAVASAAGNPMFATELLRVLADEGSLVVVDGRAELERVVVPPSLRATINRTLAFLGADALALLSHASVLGTAFSLADLAAVTGVGASDLTRRLRPAVQAGLLVDDAGRLRFRHDLVRSAIYEDHPVAMRAALHVEAAQRLAAAGASSLQVAEHIVLGGTSADATTIDRLHEAAREVGRQAPATAVRLLEHALEMSGGGFDRRAAMLADLVTALLWCGRPQEAEQRAREGLRMGSDAPCQGLLWLGLVQALSVQGRYRALIDEVERALRTHGVTEAEASTMLAEAANAHLLSGDVRTAETTAREAVSLGRSVGSEGVAAGLMILSDVARGRGEFQGALDHALEAVEVTERRGGVVHGWRPEIFLAMALRELDRFDEAHAAIQRGRIADEERGHVTFLPVYGYELATGHFLSGRWDEAVTEADRALALADEVGLVMLRSWPRSLLALIAVQRGDLEAAAAHLADLDPVDPAASSAVGLQPPREALARSLLAEANGDAAAALVLLQRAWDGHGGRGNVSALSQLAPDLVRLALASGDRTTAAGVTLAVEHAARRQPVTSVVASAWRCRGLVDADADVLVRAAEHLAESPRRFEHAQACEAAAAALARADRRSEAKPLFDAAIDAMGAMGAQRAAASALASARTLGIGRRRRGARTRAAYGWEALTPSETEVVALAADGLTNPEVGRRLCISRRTVQSHLSSAFRKLEITSRVELAALVARRGRTPGERDWSR